jgi:hypothetical protein
MELRRNSNHACLAMESVFAMMWTGCPQWRGIHRLATDFGWSLKLPVFSKGNISLIY